MRDSEKIAGQIHCLIKEFLSQNVRDSELEIYERNQDWLEGCVLGKRMFLVE